MTSSRPERGAPDAVAADSERAFYEVKRANGDKFVYAIRKSPIDVFFTEDGPIEYYVHPRKAKLSRPTSELGRVQYTKPAIPKLEPPSKMKQRIQGIKGIFDPHPEHRPRPGEDIAAATEDESPATVSEDVDPDRDPR
ncbi:MAG: hypothetical protein CMH83_00200 [Nocardioides sp.]|nr:hypothetical protein [Nocardioides sp.]